jgi:CO/xanthine dehydrogenase Mo-binding subunit
VSWRRSARRPLRNVRWASAHFHDYSPLRMSEMPKIDAVTGKRLRELPLRLDA